MAHNLAEPSAWILLVGAGFSANFGGFVARDVGNKIFNRVSAHEQLRDLLHRNADFESAFEEVLTGAFSDAERKAFSLALFETYREMDKTLRGWSWGPGSAY